MRNYNTDRTTERRNDEISGRIIPLKLQLSYCMLYTYIYIQCNNSESKD